MTMGSVTEEKQKECQLTSVHLLSGENVHQFTPETRRPDRTSSFCSKAFSESDPLLPNEFYGTALASGTLSQIHGQEMPSESVRAMVMQILFPFLLAGFGTVLAGMLLDEVQVSRELMMGWILDKLTINGIFFVCWWIRIGTFSVVWLKSSSLSHLYWVWRGTWRWHWHQDFPPL